MKLAALGSEPEVFRSLQGEGLSLGVPCIFVRTSRCNLFCGFCDTPYTWNWHGSSFAAPSRPDNYRRLQSYDRDAQTLEVSVDDLVERLRRWPPERVVLTGGEPLLQQAECTHLMRELLRCSSSYSFEVETNGTIEPTADLALLVSHFTVSPKLSGSAVPQRLRLLDAPLRYYSASQKSFFKFVVAADTDLEEIETLIERYTIDRSRVFLMPEARSRTELDERSAKVAERCLDAGYRFSDRLHLRLYGGERGS